MVNVGHTCLSGSTRDFKDLQEACSADACTEAGSMWVVGLWLLSGWAFCRRPWSECYDNALIHSYSLVFFHHILSLLASETNFYTITTTEVSTAHTSWWAVQATIRSRCRLGTSCITMYWTMLGPNFVGILWGHGYFPVFEITYRFSR